MKHTAGPLASLRPWRVEQSPEGFWQVWTARDETPGSRNNYVIADGIQSEDEARLIVAAVNSHAQLLEACKWFMSALDSGVLQRSITNDAQNDFAFRMVNFVAALHQAKAAIAAAEGSAGK